jgi:membrane protein YqaA with SNARE-associated domain
VTSLGIYLSLFVTSFLAATILPMSSEAVLAGLLAASSEPWIVLIAIASAGNILGSLTNWGVGRGLALAREHPRFPVDRTKLAKAENWYRRWGCWSLLLSWVPVIGDPLTIAAGFLREPFWIVLALVSIAKIGRYLVIAAIVAKWV